MFSLQDGKVLLGFFSFYPSFSFRLRIIFNPPERNPTNAKTCMEKENLPNPVPHVGLFSQLIFFPTKQKKNPFHPKTRKRVKSTKYKIAAQNARTHTHTIHVVTLCYVRWSRPFPWRKLKRWKMKKKLEKFLFSLLRVCVSWLILIFTCSTCLLTHSLIQSVTPSLRTKIV